MTHVKRILLSNLHAFPSLYLNIAARTLTADIFIQLLQHWKLLGVICN